MTKADVEGKMGHAVEMLDLLLQDATVPRNVKRAIEEAKTRLQGKEDPVVKAGSAVYCLEGASEDINLPPHARTQIWNIVSTLETIREAAGR